MQNNILQGDRGELKISGASPIFEVDRMALGCSSLLLYCRTKIAPHPKLYADSLKLPCPTINGEILEMKKVGTESKKK